MHWYYFSICISSKQCLSVCMSIVTALLTNQSAWFATPSLVHA